MVGAVRADTLLVNQPYDGTSIGRISQVFPDQSSFTTYQFDDFTTDDQVGIGRFIAPGFEGGSAAANLAVTGEIWTGLPDQGGTLVMSGNGAEDAMGVLTIDFDGQTLDPGSYWITAFVTRNDSAGGQWFWYATTPVTLSEAYLYNPGNGFGLGSASIPGSTAYGQASNMAFELYAIPEPSSLALAVIGLGTAALGHARVGRKKRRSSGEPLGRPRAGRPFRRSLVGRRTGG